MNATTKLAFVVTLILACCSCGVALTRERVHEATGTIPKLPRIDITEPARFLNDLMLSPYWKVEKQRDGSFIAKARSVGQGWPADGTGAFLYEFMANPKQKLPEGDRIFNKYLRGHSIFSSFTISVLFGRLPSNKVPLGNSEKTVTIPVEDMFSKKIGPNSGSSIAIKLSTEHDIYVIFYEQGRDPDRKTTFAKLLPAMQELAAVAELPETYLVKDRYDSFFKKFFAAPFEDTEIQRFPGIQDRDTFYGYVRAKSNTSYAGVNIKISHPVYCPDEGTRKHSRLQKAEYLGKPYEVNDLLFFLIEDNAVYLSGEYDQRFGTFTGKESFEGDLEVLNDQGAVLLKTKGPFKGWQR